MEGKIRVWEVMMLVGMMLLLPEIVFAKGGMLHDSLPANETDTVLFSRRILHRAGLEFRPGYILPTHPFMRGDNERLKPIRNALSAHLKYSFRFCPDTYADQVYGGVYQGVGLGYYSFGNRKEVGNPIAFYLFQGARIAGVTPRLSLNYEWDFGLSAGWKPYDLDNNYQNQVIGSAVNAYMNVDFYLNWMLSRQFDLTTGVTLSHFSNGNTKFPNAGLNTVGLKIGLVYNFNREDASFPRSLYRPPVPELSRRISYDLLLFGSWRRKGVVFGDTEVPSPEAYTVLGFSFAPMYTVGYKFRVGVSADVVYDGSANVYTEDYIVGTPQPFYKPSLNKQLGLGLSGRAEYVMPFFTVGLGLGVNVLHGGGDLKAFYQILALKIEVTRNSYLHIGYSLQNFHTPNFLMLGIGFRFHNKYPVLYR